MLKTFLLMNKINEKEFKSFCSNKAISGYCFDETHESGLINILRDDCDISKQFMVIIQGINAKKKLLELNLNTNDIIIINRDDINNILFYEIIELITERNLKTGIILGQFSPIENVINLTAKMDYVLLVINHISREHGSEKLLGLSRLKNGNKLQFIIGIKTDLSSIDGFIANKIEEQGAQDIILIAN